MIQSYKTRSMLNAVRLVALTLTLGLALGCSIVPGMDRQTTPVHEDSLIAEEQMANEQTTTRKQAHEPDHEAAGLAVGNSMALQHDGPTDVVNAVSREYDSLSGLGPVVENAARVGGGPAGMVMTSPGASMNGLAAKSSVVPPCTERPCPQRNVSLFDVASFSIGSEAAFDLPPAASVEEILEKGLALAEASPVHLVVRGMAREDSTRCEWRGVARTPDQREQAIRFWLDIDDSDPLPTTAEVEQRFMEELDRINPV